MANFPLNYTPTRYPKGVGNVDSRHPLGRLPVPSQTKGHIYQNDFDAFASGDWTATTVGTGTNALIAGDGGLLRMATSGATNDSNILTKLPAAFTLVAGFRAWFRIGITLSDISACQIMAGLVNAVTGYAPTDGMWFSKAAAGTQLVFNQSAASTATSVNLPANGSLPLGGNTNGSIANATQFSLACEYDGKTSLLYFVNDVRVGTLSMPTLPVVNLTPAFGIKTSANAVKNMDVDFLTAAKQRADLNPMLP